MDFGRVNSLDGIDFKLPDEDQFLIPAEKSDVEVLLGATGWSMPQWKGTIYPHQIRPTEYATFYSQQFASIEFNTTYYQIPPAERVKKWYDSTVKDFIFCPKVFSGISQSNSLGMGSSLFPDFLERMLGFQEKLGLLFMQLPQSFHGQKLTGLEKFVSHWQKGIPLSIELRHQDWFLPALANDLAQLLFENGISWLITDVPGRRDVNHSFITAPFVAVRFVCSGHDDTDKARIFDWVERIANWSDHGVHLVYFFVHSPENLTPHIGMSWFAENWEKLTGKKLKIPILERTIFDF